MQKKHLKRGTSRNPYQVSKMSPCYMSEGTTKTIKKNKQNDDTERIYFMENQCEILKLKARDIEVSLRGFKAQLVQLQENKQSLQKSCLEIEKEIQLVENGKVPEHKANLQKLERALQSKVGQEKECEARVVKLKQNIERESFNVKQLIQQENNLNVEKWKVQSEMEGMNALRHNLEGQIQKLQADREKLTHQKINYEPQQSLMDVHIQQTVQIVNSHKDRSRNIQINLSCTALINLLHKTHSQRLEWACRSYIVGIQLSGLKAKKMLAVLLISNQFIDRVKNKYFQRFKRLIKPTKEQARLSQSLQNLKSNKLRFNSFSIWRREFAKSQLIVMKKKQMIGSIVAIKTAMQTSLLFWSFAYLKDWNKNSVQRAIRLNNQLTALFSRQVRKGFSSLVVFNGSLVSQEMLESFKDKKGAFNTLRMFFKAWSGETQQVRLVNLAVKYKVFRILIQNRSLSRKGKLQQVMQLIVRKNNINNLLIKGFWGLKTSTKTDIIEEYTSKGEQIEQEMETVSIQATKSLQIKKMKSVSIGFVRVESICKSKIKKTFDRLFLVYSNILKLTALDRMLGRILLVDSMSRGFRCLLLNKTLSEQRHVKSEIDTLVRNGKTQADKIQIHKLQMTKYRKQHVLHSTKYLCGLLKHQYQTLVKSGFRMMQKTSIKVCRVQRTLKRLVSGCTRRLTAQVFTLVQVSAITKNRVSLLECGVNHMRLKKSMIFKKAFISELESNSRRNFKLRNVLKQSCRIVKTGNLFWSFGTIKTFVYTFRKQDLKTSHQAIQANLQKQSVQISKKNKDVESFNLARADRCSAVGRYKHRSVLNRLQRLRLNPARLALAKWLLCLNKDRSLKALAKKTVTVLGTVILRSGWTHFLVNIEKLKSLVQQSKYSKVLSAYETNSKQAAEYAVKLQQSIVCLKVSSHTNTIQTQRLTRLLTSFEDTKIGFFKRKWTPKLMHMIVTKWSTQSREVKARLTKVVKILTSNQYKQAFDLLSQGIKQQKLVNSAKRLILIHMHRADQQSTRNLFVYWKTVSNKIKRIVCLSQIVKNRATNGKIETQIETSGTRFEDECIKYFVSLSKKRVFNFLQDLRFRKHISELLDNKIKGTNVRIQCQDAILTLRQYTQTKKQSRELSIKSDLHAQRRLRSISFVAWKSYHQKLKILKKCFVNNWVQNAKRTYENAFFSQLKRIAMRQRMTKSDHHSSVMHKLVTFYENVLVCSMQKGLCKWRNNSETLKTRRQFLMRLVKRSTRSRIQSLWGVWKLQAKARSIQQYHEEQGQIKLKRNQYQRTLRHISQFKQQKGLVLYHQNQIVLSPRFGKRKSQQQQLHKMKKYQLLSSLILVQSGQAPKIQLWNSLKFYVYLKEKIRQKATLVHNYLRNPELYQAFKTWRNQVEASGLRLQTIQKSQLVHQIRGIEDKIEVLHSSKEQLKQEVICEIHRTELIHSRLQSKQTLTKIIIVRAVSRLQAQALQQWRTTTKRMTETEEDTIQKMALRRLQQLTQEILGLQSQLHSALLTNQDLESTVMEGVEIAENVKMLSSQRDQLSSQIQQQSLTCEGLAQQNAYLQSKLNMAHKEAFQLLSLAKN